MTSYSPTPWWIEYHDGAEYPIKVFAADTGLIAEFLRGDQAEDFANAKMMRASPRSLQTFMEIAEIAKNARSGAGDIMEALMTLEEIVLKAEQAINYATGDNHV